MLRTQTISSYKSIKEYDEFFESAMTEDGLDVRAYGESNLISIAPKLGAVNIGGSLLHLEMTPENVHRILGKPDCTRDNFGSCKHIAERYRNEGFILRYWNFETSYPGHNEMGLYEVMVSEKNGWQVEVDGINLFDDEKLSQMKAQYLYTESKRKTAVAFPTLGILTVGCGEKENDAHTEKGKLVFFCNSEVMRFYISKINMWD
jgi:hypothetical protein